jgi:hypothetical protein
MKSMQLRTLSGGRAWIRGIITLCAIVVLGLSVFLAGSLDTRRSPIPCPGEEQGCDPTAEEALDRRTWERLGIVLAGAAVAVTLRRWALRWAKDPMTQSF